MRKEVRTQEAIGLVLAHDLTRIVPGEFKGAAFRKGHVVREEDIEALLAIGKEHIYVLDIEAGELHENDAAIRMAAALAATALLRTEPHEGKVTLKAPWRGVLAIDEAALNRINAIGELVVVTKRSGALLESGASLAGLRAIPLVIEEINVETCEHIARVAYPVIDVKPLRSARVGVVTTGSEVAKGRIQDRFGPIIERKLAALDSSVAAQRIVGDETGAIAEAIRNFLTEGVDMVLVTGGMSVDPDDRTPGAIREVATEIVSYGMPVLPGSMTMLAYADDVPIFGLPACVIYDDVTVFDLLLPRVLAGERLSRDDIARLGHGGWL